MSVEYDGSARNPEWERVQLITDIRSTLTERVAEMAIAIGSNLEVLQVLHGRIEPPLPRSGAEEDQEYLTLLNFTTETASFTHIRLLGRRSFFASYDLSCTQADIEKLELPLDSATYDRNVRNFLSWTVFGKERSEHSLDRYMKQPLLLPEDISKPLQAMMY